MMLHRHFEQRKAAEKQPDENGVIAENAHIAETENEKPKRGKKKAAD